MRCFKKKGPDRQPSFVLGSQYPGIQYHIITRYHKQSPRISISVFITVSIVTMRVQFGHQQSICLVCQYKPIPNKTHGSKIMHDFHGWISCGIPPLSGQNNQSDQQDTVRRKVHGDPPNPRVLHLGIKQTNLTGDGIGARISHVGISMVYILISQYVSCELFDMSQVDK